MAALGRCAPVLRIRAPSVADFNRFFVKPMLPVVLEGAASEWPAISRWRDDKYLHAAAGEALVDVEVGRSFLDPLLQQQRISLSSFMRQHLHQRVSCPARHRAQPRHPTCTLH